MHCVKVPVSHLSRKSVRTLWHERLGNAFGLADVKVVDEPVALPVEETREGWDCVELSGDEAKVAHARDRLMHHLIDTGYLPEDTPYPEIELKEQ